MMRLYCSQYLNNTLKGARVVLCTLVCNFLELGQFGSPNSKAVSKGCAWGLFDGNIVQKYRAVRA